MSINKKARDERNARFQAALDNAYRAADAAQVGMVEDMRALDCGFAWVVVHDQAFMRWCRENVKRCREEGEKSSEGTTTRSMWRQAERKYGDKHHAAGWCFWKPGSFNGQSVGIHEAGAKAFATSLAHELQIRCEWSSRLD